MVAAHGRADTLLCEDSWRRGSDLNRADQRSEWWLGQARLLSSKYADHVGGQGGGEEGAWHLEIKTRKNLRLRAEFFAALFGFFAVGFLTIEAANAMLSPSYSVPSMGLALAQIMRTDAPAGGPHHEKAALDHWIGEYLGRAA